VYICEYYINNYLSVHIMHMQCQFIDYNFCYCISHLKHF